METVITEVKSIRGRNDIEISKWRTHRYSSILKVESTSKFPRRIDVIISKWIRLSKSMKFWWTFHVEFRRWIDKDVSIGIVNQVKFICLLVFVFFSPCYPVYKSTLLLLLLLLLILPLALLSIFLSLKNFTLSLLLISAFLFFLILLILLYLFVIVFFSQCCYSYQVNIAIIVSLANFLIYTFDFYLWVLASQVSFN